MEYREFDLRFGAASRTKNILTGDTAAREVGHGANKRRYALPGPPEIPREFIRLCPWETEYLFTVARRARLGILETGRCNGGSLFVMACAAPEGVPLHSIDLAPKDDDLLRSLLALHRPQAKIDLIVGDSQNSKYSQIGMVDLLFIDGDHTYKGCIADLSNWYDHLVQEGHLLLHDSYLGDHGVQDAIIDFMSTHPELMIVQSPYIGADYWCYPAGSIAHFIKRSRLPS